MACPAFFHASKNDIAAGIRAAKTPKVLKRCYTLKRNKNFRRVYRKGKSVSGTLLVLVYARAREKKLHVGLSVSKRIGNSVVRNRVKRRLRESFTPMIPCVKSGYDLIFIAREPVVQAKFTEIEKAMRKLLRKAALLVEEEDVSRGDASV